MKILSKEKAWIWLLIGLFTCGMSNIILGALLDVYDKDAWYKKPQNWIFGLLCLIFPFFIMIFVFYIQITTQACAKLNVPFKEIYLCPYIWIICLGIPIFGWILFLVMTIYVTFWPVVMLHRGAGEKFIDEEDLYGTN